MPEQIGFAFLPEVEQANDQRKYDRATEHLPSEWGRGLDLYRDYLNQHHRLMMAGDIDQTMRIRREAHDLAVKLDGGRAAICAPDGAGKRLEAETRAEEGRVPIWGQTGSFVIDVDGMQVRVEQKGIFGVGATWTYWPGFYAHAGDRSKPFLSETGYRTFIGMGPAEAIGIGPDEAAAMVIRSHVAGDMKGKLVRIVPLVLPSSDALTGCDNTRRAKTLAV